MADNENTLAPADAPVRYCPECGHIGAIKPPALTCCPDSFGMQIRRWQAKKMERILAELRARIAASGHQTSPSEQTARKQGGSAAVWILSAIAAATILAVALTPSAKQEQQARMENAVRTVLAEQGGCK